MPIRRFNYTGRKRLKQTDTRITLCEPGNGTVTFDADLDLSRYELPDEALVSVEAQRQTSWMRFPFGAVGELRVPDDRELREFDWPEGILFRVRVTSEKQPRGLLLAEASRIRPRRREEVEEERVPLLPVKPDEGLDDEVFRVDFSDRPTLLINSRVGDWRSAAKDPVFTAMAYPGAMREILARILYVEHYHDKDDDEDWRSQWLRYASLLPGVTDLPGEREEDRFDDWIDEAVASFCRRFRMYERFSGYWTGEDAR